MGVAYFTLTPRPKTINPAINRHDLWFVSLVVKCNFLDPFSVVAVCVCLCQITVDITLIKDKFRLRMRHARFLLNQIFVVFFFKNTTQKYILFLVTITNISMSIHFYNYFF